MAKFQFAFEKVMRHRKTLEELAQKDFQEAMAVLTAETEKLEAMQKQKSEAFVNRHRAETQGTSGQVAALTQVHDFLKGQDVRMDRQRKRIQDIEKQVEELREVLRQKAVDTKIIEGLREKKREEFVAEQKKLEQKRTDDVNSTRFAKVIKE